jgi:hypothetical protein
MLVYMNIYTCGATFVCFHCGTSLSLVLGNKTAWSSILIEVVKRGKVF